MPKKWWYNVLNKAITSLKEFVGFHDVMTDYAELMREQFMRAIVENQPYGHEEYDPAGYYAVGTVSQRIGHTPIEDGWRAETSEIKETGLSWSHSNDWAGVRLKVTNVSEHIAWVIGGAYEHIIPQNGSPSVRFWWGEPQRWPQPDGEDPGYFRFKYVEHPGQKPNPFVERTKDDIRPNLEGTIKTGVGMYLHELMTNAGLRKV